MCAARLPLADYTSAKNFSEPVDLIRGSRQGGMGLISAYEGFWVLLRVQHPTAEMGSVRVYLHSFKAGNSVTDARPYIRLRARQLGRFRILHPLRPLLL